MSELINKKKQKCNKIGPFSPKLNNQKAKKRNNTKKKFD